MPLELGDGIAVTVAAPRMPVWRTAPPSAGTAVRVLPVVGPRGPEGPPGRDGADSGEGGAGYQHNQTGPAQTWQLVHNLGYRPNITVHTTDGDLVSYERIAHPVPGSVTEVTFGTPIAGYADAS